MKIFLKVLLILCSLTTYESRKTCKTDVLRSFGLHSRISPNRGNVLCPKIDFNCCTVHDQMLIHKKWTTHIKYELSNHFAKQIEETQKFMVTFLQTKSMLDLKRIVTAF